MLSNAYFLAKFRFDTAENEPAKKLQNFLQDFAKFANFADSNPLTKHVGRQLFRADRPPVEERAQVARVVVAGCSPSLACFCWLAEFAESGAG